MAIKIPRVDIEVPSVGKRGTALLDTARTNRINYEGFTSELSSIAQTIKAHNDKINQRRIQNKSTKYNALMSTDAQNFSQEIEIGKYNVLTKTYDPYTVDEINQKVKKFETDMEGKYKNKIFKDDKEGWDHFESYYFGNIKQADHGAHQGTKKKILADSAIAYSIAKMNQNETINKTPVSEVMWIAMNTMIEQEKQLYTTSSDAVNIDLTKNIQDIKNKFIIKAVTAGHEKQLFGDGINGNTTGYNWTKINQEIKSDKDYFGYKLTKTEKEFVLDYVKNKAIEQDFFETRAKNQHNENLFKSKIDGIRDGTIPPSEVEKLDFTKDEEGTKLKNDLVTYSRNKMLGNLPDESDIAMFRNLRSEVVDMSVTSLTEKVILSSDNKLDSTIRKEYSNKKGEFIGMSIMERVNAGLLSDDDYGRLYAIINDPQLTTNLREYSKMDQAYEKEIRGVLDKWDLKADIRVYQLETEAERAFIQGLKDGKKPEDMLDPFHDDFILKPALLEKYSVNISQQSKSIAEQMAAKSTTIGEVKWEGPVWENYKDKYATIEDFDNGIEMRTYMETESYKKWDKATKGADVKVASGTKKTKKVSNTKVSGVFKFKEYDDGSVEPITKAKTLKYYEWLKVYGKTHKKDGTPINKGFLMKDNVKQKKTEKKKDSIKQKALDLVNEKRFDKRDGVYYYKGSDIKVDAKVLE